MLNFPETLLYSADHQWLDPMGDVAKIGITAFAAGELGEIAHLDIAAPGQKLEAGEVFGSLEALKAVFGLYIPVSGIILEANPKVINTPGLLNTDPYGEAWLVKIGLTEPEEAFKLLTASEYRKLI